jgi:hypothetical protein
MDMVSCNWYLSGVFLFAAGFVNIDYNIEPLDAGAMNFAEDPSISFKMIVESYPLFWIISGLIAAVLFFVGCTGVITGKW